MHELAIATALVDLVRHRMPRCVAGHELAVTVEVGALTGIAPASLAFYFEGLTRGTPLEGAALECRFVPARVRCRACGAVYEPEGFARVCTACGALGGEVLAGTELHLLHVGEKEASGV